MWCRLFRRDLRRTDRGCLPPVSLCRKGLDDESLIRGLPVILWELTDWFRRRTESDFGGSKCDEILAKSADKCASP